MYVLMYILSVMTVKSCVTLSKIFYHKKSECAIEFSQILCILSSFSPNAFLYTDSSPCFSFFFSNFSARFTFFLFHLFPPLSFCPQLLIIYLHLSSAIFFCALFNNLPGCNPCMCIVLLDMHFMILQIWIIILFDKNQFPATIVISVVIIYYLWNNNNAWFFRIGEALEKYDSNRSKTN